MYLSLELVTVNSTCCFAWAFPQNIERSEKRDHAYCIFVPLVSNVWFTEHINKRLFIE